MRPNRFFLQTLQTCYVEDCEFIQDIKSPLPLCHKSLHPCIKTSSSSTSVDRFSNKIRPVHGRCILIRLGHSNATIPIQGDFQGWSQVPSYQCKGSSDSLFRPSSNKRKRSTDSNKNRLSSGIECDVEKRFIVSSYVSNFSLNLEQNLFNTTNPSSVSHSRGYECENRPSVKTNSVVNRMVSTKVHFQALLLSVQDQSTSGFVYIWSEPSSEDLHLSLPGSSGLYSERYECHLEEIKDSLSLYSNSLDFQGFNEAKTREFRQRLTDLKRLQGETLVCQPEPALIQFVQVLNSSTTSCQWQSNIPRHCPLDRVLFIQDHYSRRFSADAASLLIKPIRDSSARKYQNKWKLFLEYLDQNNFILKNALYPMLLTFL